MTRHFLDPRLAGLVRYVPGEVPRDGRPVIKLNTNENPFPWGVLDRRAAAPSCWKCASPTRAPRRSTAATASSRSAGGVTTNRYIGPDENTCEIHRIR